MRVALSAACAVAITIGASVVSAREAGEPDRLAVRAIDLLWTADIPAFRRLIEEHPQVLNLRGPGGSTPFMYAAIYGDAEMLQWLLDRGADPNRRNDAQVTALMWAVDDAAMVQVLINAGADVNARSADGLTPVAIAASRAASDAVVRLLLSHGAKEGLDRQSGPRCKGGARPPDVRREQSLDLASRWAERIMQGLAPGDGPSTVATILLHLHAQQHKRDLLTDALARYLKTSQQRDGRWIGSGPQAVCCGDIGQTALAARALQLYMPPQFQPSYEESILAALRWLTRADARNNDDRAYRLMGLVWSGATKYGVLPAKKELIAAQREDGGWADAGSRTSTAPATELALAALREAGVVPEEPSYKKAMQFLRTTPRAALATPES